MWITVNDDIPYSLLFIDDQAIEAGDRNDAFYMFRK